MTNLSNNVHCLALSGGVGGAKLALGLSEVLAPDQVTVIANTGDDFNHLGFHICPDLDTVMYTLADVSNKEVGWGQEGETWHFLEALQRLEGETWFKLGDRDLATHIARTVKLGHGRTLSEVTQDLCRCLSIDHCIVPMSDDTISTVVHTDSGDTLSFQHYFVRDRCEPVVTGFDFEGIEEARPSPGFLKGLEHPNLGLIIICPSNPFVSVDPILLIPGVKELIAQRKVPMVAVSPIISGLAIKGPAAKMMKELGMPQTATAVAEHYKAKYGVILTGFIIDEQDRALSASVEALGLETIVTNTVMVTLQDRINLANESLKFAKGN